MSRKWGRFFLNCPPPPSFQDKSSSLIHRALFVFWENEKKKKKLSSSLSLSFFIWLGGVGGKKKWLPLWLYLCFEKKASTHRDWLRRRKLGRRRRRRRRKILLSFPEEFFLCLSWKQWEINRLSLSPSRFLTITMNVTKRKYFWMGKQSKGGREMTTHWLFRIEKGKEKSCQPGQNNYKSRHDEPGQNNVHFF